MTGPGAETAAGGDIIPLLLCDFPAGFLSDSKSLISDMVYFPRRVYKKHPATAFQMSFRGREPFNVYY